MAQRIVSNENSTPFIYRLPIGVSSKSLTQRLVAVSSEMARLAEDLENDRPVLDASPQQIRELAASKLRKMIATRTLRDRILPAHIFADPAWDMLLDLAVAQHDGRRISISSLSLAARVPTTTALRWIKSLQGQGILTIEEDDHDGRRRYVKLSDDMFERLVAFAVAV